MDIFNICLGNGWSIESSIYEKGIAYDEELFGQFETIDDKIVWIYDIKKPSDDDIQKCKTLDIFNTKKEFIVYALEKDEWQEQEKFSGTFIDALEYIKENFR